MKLTIYRTLLLAALATLAVACGHTSGDNHDGDHEKEEAHAHKHAPGEIEFSEDQARAAGLRTEKVAPADFSEVIHVSGRIMPARGGEATVTATMAGIINSAVIPTEGQSVGAGQALFSVSAAGMADGNPAAAAQAELQAAKKELARAEELAKDGIVSQKELEQARLRYRQAASTANSLGSAKQTRAATSPISGFVKQVLVKRGDYVAAGQALAIVAADRRLQLRADVPERHYSALPFIETANFREAYGGAATMSVAALGGRLVARGRSAEGEGYFVPVTFEFDNRGGVVPGALAEVWLKGKVRQGVISVPLKALTEEQGVKYVYVRTSDHTFRKQEVKVGADDGQRVEVTSGLHSGDEVVVEGAVQVKLAAAGTSAPVGHSH